MADRARRFAAAARLPAGWADLAAAAGWLHDLGKYRPEFQDYLEGRRAKGDPETWHKQAGAAFALKQRNGPLAFVIAGHHGGLPDATVVKGLTSPAACPAGLPVVEQVWSQAVADCPPLGRLAVPEFTRAGHDVDLLTRVLFGCLVDADWADTAAHERHAQGLPPEPDPGPLPAADWLANTLAHIGGKAGGRTDDLTAARNQVLHACLAAAAGPPGVYALTVPTGGGKTLAALAFALAHAAAHGLRRVVYAAPYLTILEQTADALRAAVGVGRDDPRVFAHYSLAEPPVGPADQATAAAVRRAEGWDAPLVVTTNVQLFESLFGHHPGRCRKLHRLPGSVLVLDECQCLPPGLAAPTCGVLRQLADQLGCTVLLCTATQPAFDHARLREDERLTATEVVPAGLRLFERLRRVTVRWPRPADPRLAWPEVAARLRAAGSGLCVVNTKRAARGVFEALRAGGQDGVFHLSTAMCPEHRRAVLRTVRERLAARAPCLLASTQLIEAGVDVDFPVVMRELGPLESVVQAAGRCNREGRLPGGGAVEVFRTAAAAAEPQRYYPPDRWYAAGREIVEAYLKDTDGAGPQPDDPAATRAYFGRLYHAGMSLDAPGIQALRAKFQ